MERYLLDSSAILNILLGTPKGNQIRLFAKNAELITSIICYCEVLNKSDLDKQNKAETLLSQLSVFPLTLTDGQLAKKLQYECRKAGGYVPTLDCLVAATASNQDAEVVTSDSDFSRIEGVKRHVF